MEVENSVQPGRKGRNPVFATLQDTRFGRLPKLMPRRVQEILLVSSPYDSYILE
ncbi:MAG: hypothetical protein AB7N71_04095 [Phycisphaerae bacterium]